MEFTQTLVLIAVFLAVSIIVGVLSRLLGRNDDRMTERLADLSETGPDVNLLRRRRAVVGVSIRQSLAKFGTRMMGSKGEWSALQQRLLKAGCYSPSAASILVAVRFLLIIVAVALGALFVSLQLVKLHIGMLLGTAAVGVAMVAPTLWLDRRGSSRQRELRRGLPEFLDLLITCLECGLSFEGALQRVSQELRTAHPLLSAEMFIVQREIAMGGTVDAALRKLAERSGLEEIRTLASFVDQTRRFGGSISDALRTHADMLRTKREQEAEEKAQKAAVKILMPTLLFILPAVFVVLVGPAAMEMQKMLDAMPDKEPAVQSQAKP
ncbi:MAG: type II secretion system F family protein [Planctomycetaceae bacterium]